MTGSAVLAKFVQMDVVVENNPAGVFRLDGNDLELFGIKKYRKRYQQQQRQQKATQNSILLHRTARSNEWAAGTRNPMALTTTDCTDSPT